MKNEKGFTLIELMVVIAIIGILAAIAVPQFSAYRTRAFKCEGKSLSGPIIKDVIDFFEHTGRFPENNFQCGVAKPEYIKGKYVDSISVENGIITILFNDSQEALKNQYTKLIPQINVNNPTGAVTWEIEGGDLKDKKQDKSTPKKKKS